MTNPTTTARRLAGSLVLAGTLAAGAWSAAAPTALAPEPAKLRAALPSSAGASASALLVSSNQSTTVRYYSSNWTADATGPAAGTPCATTGLGSGSVTTQVILVGYSGSGQPYRRCY